MVEVLGRVAMAEAAADMAVEMVKVGSMEEKVSMGGAMEVVTEVTVGMLVTVEANVVVGSVAV